MAWVPTSTEAKMHLKVDNTDEDDLIDIFIEAAEDFIEVYLDRETVPDKAAIKAAALLIIGDLYENRGAQIVGTITSENPAVMRLLQPYRRNIGI